MNPFWRAYFSTGLKPSTRICTLCFGSLLVTSVQVNDVVFNFDSDQVRVRVDRWMAGVAIRCIDSVLVNPGDDAKKNLKDNPNKDTGSPRSYIVAFVKISSHSLLNLSPLYRQVADYMWRTNLSSRGSVAVKHLPSVEVSGCLEVGEVGQNAQGLRKGKQIDILQVDIVILHIVWSVGLDGGIGA